MQRDGHDSGNGAKHDGSEDRGVLTPFFTTLVVDGKFGTADPVEDYLKADGHLVLKAESAKQALALTHRYRPDLILLDSEVDGASSVPLLPELMLEYPSAAVIVLASKLGLSQAAEAMKWGAVDVLERPLDMLKLKLAVYVQKTLFKKH